MKKLPLVILITFTALFATHVSGQKPPKGDSDVAATSTIQSSDGTANFFRIQSDGNGDYRNGIDSVQSIVQGIGDWEMDAKSSGTRRVYVDFGDPVIPGTTTAPFASALVPTRFISKCTQLGFKIRDMSLGQTRNCPLATSFDFGGRTYRITMNPANFASSEWVQWTCLSVASSRCTSWEMTPSVVQADGLRKARGQLIKVGTNRHNPDEYLGEFYFAFKVNVTTP